jgi:hypothetical protein
MQLREKPFMAIGEISPNAPALVWMHKPALATTFGKIVKNAVSCYPRRGQLIIVIVEL